MVAPSAILWTGIRLVTTSSAVLMISNALRHCSTNCEYAVGAIQCSAWVIPLNNDTKGTIRKIQEALFKARVREGSPIKEASAELAKPIPNAIKQQNTNILKSKRR